MSFGLSATDLIALPKLAWDIYNALKEAPGNHKALSDEVLSLHEILVRISENTQRLKRTLRSNERTELGRIVTRCKSVLDDAETTLQLYSVRKGRSRVWARAKFASADLTPVRLRIAAQVDRLNAYNNVLIMSTQARTERKVEKVIGALRRQGSVISMDSTSSCSSTEQSWSNFGRALEGQGITLQMAIDGHDSLKQILLNSTEQHERVVAESTVPHKAITKGSSVSETDITSQLKLWEERCTNHANEPRGQVLAQTGAAPACIEAEEDPIQPQSCHSYHSHGHLLETLSPAVSNQAVDQVTRKKQRTRSPLRLDEEFPANAGHSTYFEPAPSTYISPAVTDFQPCTALERLPERYQLLLNRPSMTGRHSSPTRAELTAAYRICNLWPEIFQSLSIAINDLLALTLSLEEYRFEAATLTLWQHTTMRVLDRRRAASFGALMQLFRRFGREVQPGRWWSIDGGSADTPKVEAQVRTCSNLISALIQEAANRGQLIHQPTCSSEVKRCYPVKTSYQPPQEMTEDNVKGASGAADYTEPRILLGYGYA